MNNDPSPSLTGLGLRDIHAPPAPDLWPPAPGWWLLAALLLVLTLWFGLRAFKAWQRRQLQRSILAELDKLASPVPTDLAAQVSILLRRIALMYFKRNEVASLSGSAWLAFLDKTGGFGDFNKGAGKVLASAPYSTHSLSAAENTALLTLARRWIRHTVEKYA